MVCMYNVCVYIYIICNVYNCIMYIMCIKQYILYIYIISHVYSLHGVSCIPQSCKLPPCKIISPPRLQSSGLHPLALQHCVGRLAPEPKTQGLRPQKRGWKLMQLDCGSFSLIQMKCIGGPPKVENYQISRMV